MDGWGRARVTLVCEASWVWRYVCLREENGAFFFVFLCVHVCIHVCVCACVWDRKRVCVWKSMYVHVCVYIYEWERECVCVCMCVCVCVCDKRERCTHSCTITQYIHGDLYYTFWLKTHWGYVSVKEIQFFHTSQNYRFRGCMLQREKSHPGILWSHPISRGWNSAAALRLTPSTSHQRPQACVLHVCCEGQWGIVCLFVGYLASQQHANVSQGQICIDNCMCCHTEIEVADQTFYIAQSQYADTRPDSPSADPIMPGFWQGSHWSASFKSLVWLDPEKSPQCKWESNPRSSTLEADALTTRPARRCQWGRLLAFAECSVSVCVIFMKFVGVCSGVICTKGL